MCSSDLVQALGRGIGFDIRDEAVLVRLIDEVFEYRAHVISVRPLVCGVKRKSLSVSRF